MDRLWRSLEDLEPHHIEALLEAEFPALHAMGSVNRRDLMRLMGASVALAGLAACDRPAPPLLSQPNDPEGRPAGGPLWYPTTLALDGYGRGVLVKSHEGRPVKIEGDPAHPASLGATDVFAQAEILSLYDPDRSRTPRRAGAPAEWAGLRRFMAGQRRGMEESGGEGTHILFGATSSPTFAALIDRLRARYPAVRFHSYSPVSDLFAGPEPIHDFASVDVVLSLGADFLSSGPAQVRHARDWSGRKRAGRRPLLMVAESEVTLTGAQADQRWPLSPARIEALARGVATALDGGRSGPDAARTAAALGTGRALVLAGAGQTPATRALAAGLNRRLASGAVRWIAPVRLAGRERVESLGALAAAMDEGRVRGLVILDCNPAYDAPADLGFRTLIDRVPASLHLGFHADETAGLCTWHVPQRHALESWGDLRAFDGSPSLQQPVTGPLVPALSPIELLAVLAGERPDGHALVGGTAPGAGAAAETVPEAVIPPAAEPSSDRLILAFRPDDRLWDGRFANNAWLQELPDPVSKLVWGNAVLVAPVTAARLGVEQGDLLRIERRGAAIEVPVAVAAGQAADVLTLPLGYGRAEAGRVGSGIGVDAYRLRTSDAPWLAGISVRKAAGKGRLITTQSHQPVADAEAVRTIAAGATLPDEPVRPSLYPEHRAAGHAWAMVIDLDACIGCGACTIACQAENNIPVVGPDEVERGREMHWIRVDRYHRGHSDAPETMFQPVPCMHCEAAPCEVVCPVEATSHSSEGLNQMVYNRCIGTRTCSSNCPYKVRRFNWLEPSKPTVAGNPRVTVRGRGVMEKCTYCVQRINEARSTARVNDRPLADGDVKTACQQVCPSGAIAFGDLNDPVSEVSRLRRSGRNYALLGELNTRPRTTYLARLRGGEDGE